MSAANFQFRDGEKMVRVGYGWLFKARRKELGLTLPETAKRAGISKGGLSKIEHGGDFQVTTLNRICKALRLYPTMAPLPARSKVEDGGWSALRRNMWIHLLVCMACLAQAIGRADGSMTRLALFLAGMNFAIFAIGLICPPTPKEND